MTCNVDAAVYADRGRSSFGCVLRNDQGKFVVGLGGCFEGVTDPKQAEAMDVKEALTWLKSKGINQVHIELDCLAVVQAINSKKTDMSYFGSIIADCKLIVQDLGSFSLYFVRRSANAAAHTLAREAGSLTERKEWCDVPFFLIDVVHNDLI